MNWIFPNYCPLPTADCLLPTDFENVKAGGMPMGVQRGLGKGLGALLGNNYPEPEAGRNAISILHVHVISPNPFQPRKEFSPESLQELSTSIRAQGVLHPIIVRPSTQGGGYELVTGERRWRASQLAGLEEIPAIIREISDKESLELALIENIQREDLNAMEQAVALQQLQTHFQATQQELADRTGLSRPHVANLMRLLQLPEAIQEDIRHQRYTSGHGRALMGISDPAAQDILRKRILDQALSVRACEELAAQWKKNGKFPFQSRATKQTPTQREKDAFARYEQKVLALLGSRKVKFRGSEERGSITVSFGSRKEFQQIMSRLGIDEITHG